MWVRFGEGESFFDRKLLRDYRRYKCFVGLLNAGECPLLGLASAIVTAVLLALCLLCLEACPLVQARYRREYDHCL